MTLTRPQILNLCEEYIKALTGSDVLSALRIHADRSGVDLRYVNMTGPERSVVYKVLLAANAQGKIFNFINAANNDGVYITTINIGDLSTSDSKDVKYPSLKITRYNPYIPTGINVNTHDFTLLEGRILNSSENAANVLLQVNILGAEDIVRVRLNIPSGGLEIPPLRAPRFTASEASNLKQTVVPTTLSVELFILGLNVPIDIFQADIWISQPNVVLIARQGNDGRYQDYTPTLAWRVNSGAEGITDFIANMLPDEMKQELGYSIHHTNTKESLELTYGHVEQQVRMIYEGLQRLRIGYLPTELIWMSAPSEIIQRVQYPEQVLKGRQANCLDGAILFASILERIGIDPLLAIIASHSLVGWKWRPEVEDSITPYSIWNLCGILDTTFLSTDLDYDVAISAAQGYVIKAKEWFGKIDGDLPKFARIIDVKAARGRPPSGIVEN